MNRKVVIEINFNNYGMNPNRLTRQWIEDRLHIFTRFTLRSLKRQSCQNFLAVVKLAGGCSDIVEDILSTYEPLPPNVQFGTSIESTRRINSYIEEAEELYIARIDSDDLYHQSFVQQLHDYVPLAATVALVNSYGYLWDTVNGIMELNYHYSPSFYTFIYRASDYLNGHRVKIPGRGTHGHVVDLPHEVLERRNYVNVIHSSNTSVKKVRSKEVLSSAEIKKVLSEFMIPE